MTRWLALLWLTQLVTHWSPRVIAWGWPGDPAANRVARELFYVMQGVQSVPLLLTLALLISRPRLTAWQARAALALAVYGAAEQSLIAICGSAYYFFTPAAVTINTALPSLCSRGASWWWVPMFFAFLTLTIMRLRREN